MSATDSRPGPDAARRRPTSPSMRGVFGVLVVIALVWLAVGIARSSWVLAVVCPVILLGYGAVLWVFRRRSETAVLLGGAGGDERQRRIMERSSALTAQVLAPVLVVAMLVAMLLESSWAAPVATICAVYGFLLIVLTWWCARRM